MFNDGEVRLRQFCECCGRPFYISQSPEWLMTHFKDGANARILSLLIANRQKAQMTSSEEMIRVMLYGSTKAVPNTAGLLSVQLAKLRDKLYRFGWDIAGPMETGKGYWLTKIDMQRELNDAD